MTFNLHNLNTQDFESLVQALSKKIIGNGCSSFGDGTDGGREATYRGKAEYPAKENLWDGYWVIQAKFKTVVTDDDAKDYEWVKKQLTDELDKYATRVNKVEYPNNYLLFTNVILTAKPNDGGKDKAEKLCREYETKYNIKNITIIANDDIQDFLINNRDVATTFAPFIVMGDVLEKILKFLDVNSERAKKINETISRFLEYEFREDMQSKLDHAGKLTSERVNLDKVFIDLTTTTGGNHYSRDNIKFIENSVESGNTIHKGRADKHNRFVLIGGPGQGKSTLTQFLAQIYRVDFLIKIDSINRPLDEVFLFRDEYATYCLPDTTCVRLPIKIALKEYAGWIRDAKAKDIFSDVSVVKYILLNINKKTSAQLETDDLELLFQNIPCLFIFDGLDEVPVSSNRDEALTEINVFTDTLIRRLNIDSLIIATTRPQGYSQEFDANRYLHLYISDLSKEECTSYLKKLVTNIIDDTSTREEKLKILLKALNDRDVSRIMRSPLQASIMAILVKSGGEPPTNRYDLFTAYYNTIFNREKQRNISSILSESPRYIHQIHNILGLYLQTVSEKSTNPSATIDVTEFENIVKLYLSDNKLIQEKTQTITNDIIEASTDRLVFISQVEDNKVGFAIRSLQEYFAAIGFIHNVEDDKVRVRIRNISTNAYWSNTLLFAIAHLAQNKDYMIDSIESMCGELNGSSDDSSRHSIHSLISTGSWLALDILNDGIYHDNPGIENKFCKIIKPLFHLPIIEKHKQLAKLSDAVTANWIIKYIEEIIKESPLNPTPWFVFASLIIEQGYSIDNFIKYLPDDRKQKFEILKIFIKEAVFPESLVIIFLNELASYPAKDLFELFAQRENDAFLNELCKVASSVEVKSILFEIVVFLGLREYPTEFDYYKNFRSLGLNLGENGTSFEKGLLEAEKITIAFEPVSGYTVPIIKSSLVDDQKLILIKNYSILVKNNLIESVCNFVQSAEYDTYKKMVAQLDILEPAYRHIIVNELRWFNSAFIFAFSKKNHDESEFNLKLQKIEDTTSESLNQSKSFFDDYGSLLGLPSVTITNGIERTQEFCKVHLGMNANKEAFNEFKKVMGWSLLDCGDNDVLKLSESKDVIECLDKSMLFDIEEQDYFFHINLVYILCFLSIDRLIEIFETKREYVDAPINMRYQQVFFTSSDQLVAISTKKLSDIMKLQILTDKKVDYKLMFRLIVIISRYRSVKLSVIPYEDMLKREDDSDFFKAMLLIWDPNFSDQHTHKVKKIIENNGSNIKSKEYQKYLIYALSNSNVMSDAMDHLIIYVYENSNTFSNNVKTELLNFVRQYIGNKPSGVSLKNLNFFRDALLNEKLSLLQL